MKKPTITKAKRDQMILDLLKKFKICSRSQIAKIIFSDNTNPVNVSNRVLKRLVTEGKITQVIRQRDKCYLYTLNPSPISHKSNKINHHLKIVDFYIQCGKPANFLVEPTLGTYQPDVFFQDANKNSICVEIQITPISHKKMKTKIDQFLSQYGKEHNAKMLVICSDYPYNKITLKPGFKLIRKTVPNDE